MKKILNPFDTAFFVVVAVLFSLSSCKKSYLDIPSKTTLSTAIYFQSQSDFQNAINGAYAPLRSLYGTSYLLGETRSDNTTFIYNSANRSYYPYEYVDQFLDDATDGATYGEYFNDYAIIARANQVLGPIDGVKFDSDSVKQEIKGEAYFLRAFCYFDLVQYYGSVPLHLSPATTLQQTALPLATVDTLYAQIISDATKAAAYLPSKAIQVPGRATSGAANTLLGNIYIVLKQWSNAEAALKKVAGYSLMPTYASVFDPANKNNQESVFEVQYMQGKDGYNSGFFYQYLPQPITGAQVTTVTGITEPDYNGESVNVPTPDMISAYEAGDSRKAASIGTITAQLGTYPYIKKYLHPHALAGNTDDDFPVYRYSEVLLFLAEALNEEGKSSDALPYLNQVRTRAGLSNYTNTDPGTLRQAIYNERRVELAFEDKRWHDLVRTGQAVTVMQAQGAKIKANPQAYYFPLGIVLPGNVYTNIPLLFPKPSSEASLSPYF